MSKILAHGNVVHWFAANVKTPHRKVSAVPCGVTEHTEIHFGMFSKNPRYSYRIKPGQNQITILGLSYFYHLLTFF